jgi:uncharacterized RDD family membrane protein YckC
MTARPVPYAGVATRAIALAVDMALAHVIVFAGGAILALVGSLVGELRLDTLERVLAACAWAAVVGTYFVLFWTTAGQTPGMRLMGVKLMTADGRAPSVPRSIVRLIGLGLAIVPLFLGFVPALLDARRRALQDFLAGTVVLYAHAELPAPDWMVVRATPAGHRSAPLPPRPGPRRMPVAHPPNRSPPP